MDSDHMTIADGLTMGFLVGICSWILWQILTM